MPTATQYWVQTREYLELAREADDFYAKETLTELAREFRQAAREAECRERDLAAPTRRAD